MKKMKTISVTRTEKVTYQVYVELPEDEANAILEDPDKFQSKLSNLCPANEQNWLDAEFTELDAEEAV